ncbi:MAG: hypothetical protein QOI77_2003 [Blastocatellia bacterium]|jgi:hypothetical protein|nr:hypothetical protein [Blastocatellia bacterium]
MDTMTKTRARLSASALITFVITLCVGEGKAQNAQLMRNLSTIDKVELQAVIDSELWIKGVEATKTIEGVDAQKVAQLWRSQKWNRTGYACHRPVYAIKFFSHGKLIFYASICWECHNVYFVEPNTMKILGSVGVARSAQRDASFSNFSRNS